MMDIDPSLERLTPSRSIYRDGGSVVKSARVSMRAAMAAGVSTRPVDRTAFKSDSIGAGASCFVTKVDACGGQGKSKPLSQLNSFANCLLIDLP